MSRKRKSRRQRSQRYRKISVPKQVERGKQPVLNLPVDSPATAKQRALLQLAVQKEWLYPNPFACDHAKWKNLTAGEADRLLASLSPERLGVLERELMKPGRMYADRGIARGIGRTLEGAVRQIGHSIDGGIS